MCRPTSGRTSSTRPRRPPSLRTLALAAGRGKDPSARQKSLSMSPRLFRRPQSIARAHARSCVTSADSRANSGTDSLGNRRGDNRSNYSSNSRASNGSSCSSDNRSSSPSNRSSGNRPDCSSDCPWNCRPCYRSGNWPGSCWNGRSGRRADNRSNHGSNCRARNRANYRVNYWPDYGANGPRTDLRNLRDFPARLREIRAVRQITWRGTEWNRLLSLWTCRIERGGFKPQAAGCHQRLDLPHLSVAPGANRFALIAHRSCANSTILSTAP
jgi:hypothetical protein